MGQVLYRKYRSKELAEIIGQEHITTTLENALKSGAISHAYLFTGPRGVGKTSIARILAHQLNKLEYTGEDNYLDIIEIDAASNRGIDEIRDLREKVHLAPTSGQYKVYIIDEVHMLTPQAFNALLKTLEEPPAHVVFILATTESHKLPDTIVSRTQRYAFRPIEPAKVVTHLQYIAKQEKIQADTDALQLIAEHGEGSFRDSISLLDQAASRGERITIEAVHSMLGVPPKTALQELLQDLESADSSTLLQHLNNLYEQGYQASAVAKQLALIGRAALLTQTSDLPSTKILELLRQLIDVPASAAPERLLEIILLSCRTGMSTIVPAPTPAPKVAPIKQAIVADVRPPLPSQPIPPMTVEAAVPKTTVKKSVEQSTEFELTELWPQLLQTVKRDYNTLYGILRMAQPVLVADDKLELSFKYAFHQKRMHEPKHRQIVSDTIKALTGHQVSIDCLYNKDLVEIKPIGTIEPEQPANLPTVDNSSPLATISNIFGGGELLES